MNTSILKFKPHSGLNTSKKLSGINLTTLPPLSLYVHFPWCVKKCPYCDFNSHENKKSFNENAYIEALRKDLESTLPLIWGRPIHSIFIGGGTPSLLSAAGLDQILADIRARLPMAPDIEITLEANPSSVESGKFESYAASGVNRISIGVQSFQTSKLESLGRIHNADEAKLAVLTAQKYFKLINIDLMYGLPQQTLSEAIDDLQQALAFDTGHISLYQLTLEPNTLFSSNPPTLPDEDLIDDMQEALLSLLQKNGYDRYEISAFAKKKHSCWHNQNYWSFGDYVGIGAGAHGKISFPEKIMRTVKEKHPETYIRKMTDDGQAIIEEKIVASKELPFEFMLNALRLIHGVPAPEFENRTGITLLQISKQLSLAQEKGLLINDINQLQATPLGLRFLNNLQELFLP